MQIGFDILHFSDYQHMRGSDVRSRDWEVLGLSSWKTYDGLGRSATNGDDLERLRTNAIFDTRQKQDAVDARYPRGNHIIWVDR